MQLDTDDLFHERADKEQPPKRQAGGRKSWFTGETFRQKDWKRDEF